MSRINFFFTIGLILPLPIFVDPSSNILLAQSGIYDNSGGIAFPLSMFLLPFVLLYTFFSGKRIRLKSTSILVVILSITFFCSWAFILGLYSFIDSKVSILFAAQWILPLLWFFFFYHYFYGRSKLELLYGFEVGAVIACLLFFTSGILELALYGGLLDSGRLTQNLIMKGQYQTYVYTPTAIAFSSLFVNWLYITNIVKRPKVFVIFFNIIAICSLSFLGAREGLLVYLFGMFAISLSKSVLRLPFYILMLFFILAVLFIYIDYAVEQTFFENIRILSKFKSMGNEGSALGGRDLMVTHYLKLIVEDPFFALRMLPPDIAFPEKGINAPSAHNLYIDVWAWSGLLGAIFYYLFIICILVRALNISISSFFKGGFIFEKGDGKLLVGVSHLVLLFLVVSNNINVPLRQPLTGPLFFMFVALLYTRGDYVFKE